jgi:CubicO group peptidase (beta-lactamase class C family)
MRYLIIAFLSFSFFSVKSQTYFPPLTGNSWDTLAPESLGWCHDSIQPLYSWLENTNSKAFILLKDGKIVLEKYFGTFTADSFYVWNSAGKNITAYAVGIAQAEGYLSINDATSAHIGSGWTNLTPQQENAITIRHQLTMTTGLDDNVTDLYCTDPTCLTYLAAPGTRWAYHNAPYTLLDTVISSATGMSLNSWVYSRISSKIGMTGLFYTFGYNNVFVSKPRSMARFGLLLSQNGKWNGTTVLADTAYLHAMIHPSQNLNLAYGYLTWLNGQASYKLPQSQWSFLGSLCPNAPNDMFSAQGKNAQIINVVPSQGMVLIRMGSDMGSSYVGTQYNDTIWQYINRFNCDLGIENAPNESFSIVPNPSNGTYTMTDLAIGDEITTYNSLGEVIAHFVATNAGETTLTMNCKKGIYFVQRKRNDRVSTSQLIIQ